MPLFPPMPHIDAANVASKLPEPMRKPGGMALQALLDLTGADDPASQIMGVGAVHTPEGPNFGRIAGFQKILDTVLGERYAGTLQGKLGDTMRHATVGLKELQENLPNNPDSREWYLQQGMNRLADIHAPSFAKDVNKLGR